MAGKNGCEFGAINRQKIEDLKENVESMKSDLKDSTDKMTGKMTELFNHQSQRLPLWVTMLLTGMAGFLGFTIEFIISHKWL